LIHTSVCDLLKIEYPIVQAGMGPFTSAELVAAVSNAGGIGVLGATSRNTESFDAELKRIKQLTRCPFGVNFLVSNYSEELFELTLGSKVPLISTALGDPGNFVKRAHDAGALLMHMVHTRSQANDSRKRGVDIIIAQGSEAGGYGQWVSALPLIPQIVEAVKPIPVLAAGGIADGRGMAAALILGAEGVSMGTRFLASVESPIGDAWKKMIVNMESEDTVKVGFINEILPQGRLGYGTVPRSLNTDFIKKYEGNLENVKNNAAKLGEQMGRAIMERRFNEYVPFTGESGALIREILPVGEIVKMIITDARSILDRVGKMTAKK
jgi:enoyl-[acyl-carrier protein] reductase II